jgi:hypothetical protein
MREMEPIFGVMEIELNYVAGSGRLQTMRDQLDGEVVGSNGRVSRNHIDRAAPPLSG